MGPIIRVLRFFTILIKTTVKAIPAMPVMKQLTQSEPEKTDSAKLLLDI